MPVARIGPTRVVLALAVLAVSLVATPADAACPAHVTTADRWIRIEGPDFPGRGSTIRTYDASDVRVNALVTTDGSSIVSSVDGGCTWRDAVLPSESALPDLPLGETVRVIETSITQVRYAPFQPAVVWALGQSDVVLARDVATVQPRIYVSTDGGERFQARLAGLPQFGRPVAIHGTPLGGAVLLYQTTLPSSGYEFYVTDGTGAWVRRWTTQNVLDDFVVEYHTNVAGTVWAWNSTGVYRASLGEASLTRVPGVAGNVRTVDVALAPGGLDVTVYLKDGVERLVSRDRGRTFIPRPSPANVYSVDSYARLPGVRVVESTDVNVLIEAPKFPLGVDFSPAETNVTEPQFVDVVARKGIPLYARDAFDVFLRWVPPDFRLPPTPPPPPLPPVDVEIEDRFVVPPKASIRPARHVVRLRPNQKKVVEYRVGLPPVPTPLDVFFMTDSTGSMSNTISSVQEGVQDIVDGLAASGINAWFGVADFRDHPMPPNQPGPDNSTYPYKRRRPVGPLDSDLEAALEGITTGGGTPDGHDAGLEAIYQAVTGAGRTDPLLVHGELIPPGQDARFRDEAMKVVLVATDDNFRHPERHPGYPGPSVDTVSAALKQHGVFLVGIEVDTRSGSAREDMERLAADSGAVAPEEGVDCDGDGFFDVEPDAPIVCDFDPQAGNTIAEAFVSMLAGIEDFAAVDLTVKGPAGVAVPKGPMHFADVNVKQENSFTLPVEYVCDRRNAGTESHFRIAATSRGEEIVSTTATVVCAAPDRRVPEEIVAPLSPALVAAVVPPPPPPPAPIPQVQPNPGPNPNPNPNPQVNANPGFAAQEEQQLQLALVQDDGIRYEDEFAMTGLDRAGPSTPAVAWAAAFAMTGAAAFGMHLTRRTRSAPAYNRSEHR